MLMGRIMNTSMFTCCLKVNVHEREWKITDNVPRNHEVHTIAPRSSTGWKLFRNCHNLLTYSFLSFCKNILSCVFIFKYCEVSTLSKPKDIQIKCVIRQHCCDSSWNYDGKSWIVACTCSIFQSMWFQMLFCDAEAEHILWKAVPSKF